MIHLQKSLQIKCKLNIKPCFQMSCINVIPLLRYLYTIYYNNYKPKTLYTY